MREVRSWRGVVIGLVLALALTAAACGDDDGGEGAGNGDGGDQRTLELYSGRDEELVQPIVDAFEEASGVKVDVRYGNSAELGAALLEEGERTSAEVFYSQEVGAVGVLDKAGLLSPLPDEVLERVDERFRPKASKDWIGVTGRSRVIVMNPELVDEPPTSVLDLTDPKYRGQVAWAPSNASFQAFITAFRVSRGEDAARQWLEDMIANGAEIYENNVDILEAVENGSIGLGLINHYYWARKVPEVGGVENMKSELIFPEGDDPGALVNATAAAITKNGADNPAALEFIEFLLSEEGQRRFVEETTEYPLVTGIDDPENVPPLDELAGPDLDLTDLDSLEQSLALLNDVGLLS